MRKKLLSLLTVLCLVLGMLPTTAMAAATEAYEKNEVARIITTDTEITEDVDGLVLVDAPCKVTVTDAKLSVGIVVSPDAAGAEVVLNGSTEAAEVVVLAAASVKVEETANAGIVTVDAAEAAVEIAGTAAEVVLTENAESAAVSVSGTVETVTVAAPAAAVEVAGEVKTVKVEETAAAATVTVAEEATVAAVEIAAPDVTVEVSGTVESVAVAETATGAELVVNEGAAVAEVTDATGELTVSGDGADSVTVNDAAASDEEEEEDKDDADEDDKKDEEPVTFPDTILPTPTVQKPGIVWAPLHDHKTDGNEGVNSGDDQTASLTTTHSVNVDNARELANGGIRADVTVSATGLKSHQNAAESPSEGYWIGFGIPMNEGETYKIYSLTRAGETDDWRCLGTVNTVDFTVGGLDYMSLYYPLTAGESETVTKTDTILVTKVESVPQSQAETDPEEGESDPEVQATAPEAPEKPTPTDSGLPNIEANEEVVYILDVTISATLDTASVGDDD